jgi:protocatechuate 3,4-dioxygenase beta subunit
MKPFLAVFILFASSSLLFAQNTVCSPPKENETTHWVGNLQVIVTEKKPFRQLRGTVFTPNGEPLANALVEVFTNPEYLLIDEPTSKRGNAEQKRVAACRTGADGRFAFSDLPAGKYELRSSSEDSATGWNVTQIYVVVKPSARKKRELRVEMSLGI